VVLLPDSYILQSSDFAGTVAEHTLKLSATYATPSTIGDIMATHTGTLTVKVDECASGLLVRWREASGGVRHYVWSVTSVQSATDTDSSYVTVDESMATHTRRTTTLTMSYALHSRKVEASVFDLCASILQGRDIQVYNDELGTWFDAYIDGGDVTRSMSKTLQDCEVTLLVDGRTI
jgi:hypothetical protein